MIKLNKTTRAVVVAYLGGLPVSYREYTSQLRAMRSMESGETCWQIPRKPKRWNGNTHANVAIAIEREFELCGRLPVRQRVLAPKLERVIVRPLCDVLLSGQPAIEIAK